MASLLFVNEIFASLQGEGAWTGTPSVFVRLQGCLCRCPWCDTKNTWKLGEPNDCGLDFAASKADAPRHATCTAEELLAYIDAHYGAIPHVIFTGGEPMLFDLTDVTAAFLARGKTVAIETSGTEPVRVADGVWVTVSPKYDMPGGREVLASALRRADEIKMPVSGPKDLEDLEHRTLPETKPGVLVYVQPVSRDDEATRLCVEAAMTKGWRVSFQVHKYVNMR